MRWRFVHLAGLLLLGFWLVASLPLLARALAPHVAGTSVPATLLRYAVSRFVGIGDGKVEWLRSAGIACLAGTCVAALAARWRESPLQRALVCVGLAAAIGLVLLQVGALRDDRFRFIEMQSLVTLPTPGAFDKHWVADSGVHTFADFGARAQARVTALEGAAAEAWPGLSPALRRALLYTKVVGGLWAFGEAEDPQAEGCVLRGSTTGPITVRTFLDAQEGCCADFALMLKLAFDTEGWPNRIVVIVGHQLNEVRLDGHWYTVDANSGLAFDRDWQALLSRGARDRVHVIGVQHSNLLALPNPLYRPEVGRLRLQLLDWVADRSRPVVEYRETLPDYATR